MTTCEPGASEVFTQGLVFRPLATAFLASRPAAISTLGLEVLVQEVMAAITTSPLPTSWLSPADRHARRWRFLVLAELGRQRAR